jgi:hypothetical protein
LSWVSSYMPRKNLTRLYEVGDTTEEFLTWIYLTVTHNWAGRGQMRYNHPLVETTIPRNHLRDNTLSLNKDMPRGVRNWRETFWL